MIYRAIWRGIAASSAPDRARSDRAGDVRRRAVLMLPIIALTACGGGTAGNAPTVAAPASAASTGAPPPRSAPVSVPDFKLVSYQGDAILGGHETKFSTVFDQGKPVVLNFFGGQCPPCQGEMPAFQRVANDNAGKVIFVGMDAGAFTGLGSHDDARKLLARLSIQYPAAYAVDASPLRLYNVLGLPSTVFFTASGKIADRSPGALTEPQLRGIIQRLVAAPA